MDKRVEAQSVIRNTEQSGVSDGGANETRTIISSHHSHYHGLEKYIRRLSFILQDRGRRRGKLPVGPRVVRPFLHSHSFCNKEVANYEPFNRPSFRCHLRGHRRSDRNHQHSAEFERCERLRACLRLLYLAAYRRPQLVVLHQRLRQEGDAPSVSELRSGMYGMHATTDSTGVSGLREGSEVRDSKPRARKMMNIHDRSVAILDKKHKNALAVDSARKRYAMQSTLVYTLIAITAALISLIAGSKAKWDTYQQSILAKERVHAAISPTAMVASDRVLDGLAKASRYAIFSGKDAGLDVVLAPLDYITSHENELSREDITEALCVFMTSAGLYMNTYGRDDGLVGLIESWSDIPLIDDTGVVRDTAEKVLAKWDMGGVTTK